jgi:hypothetical protein
MASRLVYLGYALFGASALAHAVSYPTTLTRLTHSILLLGGILALAGGVSGWLRDEGAPEPRSYTPTDYAAFGGTILYGATVLLLNLL